MSSEIYIYLVMERYLAQYVKHHWGDPIRLKTNTQEYKLIRCFLEKPPKDSDPDLPPGENVSYVKIEIPFFKEKDARSYNYLYPKTKKLLVDYFETIFMHNMCREMLDLSCDPNLNINDLVSAFCEKHGMFNNDDDKNQEVIRQKFYRARKKYMNENNLKLTQ